MMGKVVTKCPYDGTIISKCVGLHEEIKLAILFADYKVFLYRRVTDRGYSWVELGYSREDGRVADMFFEYVEGSGRGSTDEAVQTLLRWLRKVSRVEIKRSSEEILNI
jgi:hypothetical protein